MGSLWYAELRAFSGPAPGWAIVLDCPVMGISSVEDEKLEGTTVPPFELLHGAGGVPVVSCLCG